MLEVSKQGHDYVLVSAPYTGLILMDKITVTEMWNLYNFYCANETSLMSVEDFMDVYKWLSKKAGKLQKLTPQYVNWNE